MVCISNRLEIKKRIRKRRPRTAHVPVMFLATVRIFFRNTAGAVYSSSSPTVRAKSTIDCKYYRTTAITGGMRVYTTRVCKPNRPHVELYSGSCRSPSTARARYRVLAFRFSLSILYGFGRADGNSARVFEPRENVA